MYLRVARLHHLVVRVVASSNMIYSRGAVDHEGSVRELATSSICCRHCHPRAKAIQTGHRQRDNAALCLGPEMGRSRNCKSSDEVWMHCTTLSAHCERDAA